MARRKHAIPPELLDQLLEGSDPKTVFESDGLVDELKKALAERILDAEMDVWRELAGTTATVTARRQF
jgi:putative transposase